MNISPDVKLSFFIVTLAFFVFYMTHVRKSSKLTLLLYMARVCKVPAKDIYEKYVFLSKAYHKRAVALKVLAFAYIGLFYFPLADILVGLGSQKYSYPMAAFTGTGLVVFGAMIVYLFQRVIFREYEFLPHMLASRLFPSANTFLFMQMLVLIVVLLL